MKTSCKFTSISLICLSFSLFACTNDENRIHSAEPAKEISLEDYASIADSTLHKNVKMYRALNFKGDTTQWDESDCNIKDTSFSCYHETCVGCYTVKICRDANNNRIKCPSYKDTIYDTTYKNINFGENALVNYIPIAKIPKFNRDTVQKVLSTLYGYACAQFFEFTSNYYLEHIGLPEGFTFEKRDLFPFGFEATSRSGKCSVGAANVQYTPNNDYHRSVVRRLPEKVDWVTYQFFNGSMKSYRDTTITWKLAYTDQYGRGDTLDITTKFIADTSATDSLRTSIMGYHANRRYNAN
ncbi:hypothetical protein [Fibrobacter sp. UBA4297]|uniref:hypothetical protein n=1 Tax=Fibrobacter sp. UBA4297 TaxID=1946536 RepID=UPI0025BDE479|nr:hypothetical protein [Fibrobacter sp. UBA4297]